MATAKRALVTGACGFIGSHLVDHLLQEGWRVRATDLPEASGRRLSEGVEWIPADLTRPETLESAVTGIQVVFHTASIPHVSAPWERLYRVNALGTENLLNAARKAGVQRIVNWSSYRVYGKVGPCRSPIDENHPVRPGDAYGRSKAMQDAVVWRYHEEGLPATFVRPSVPYGPCSRDGLADLFARIQRAPFVPVPRSLTNRIMSVHVKDVVRAASFLAEREDAAGEEFNITDDGRYTTYEFVSLVARSLGKKTVPIFVPRVLLKPGALMAAYGFFGIARLFKKRPWLGKDIIDYLTFDLAASNAKIKSRGFLFTYPDPATGIRETIEYFRREGYLK
jgi:dihydroflavonol-4-reductase